MDVESIAFGKLTEWGMIRDKLLAVAFSGGGDSTALLSLMLKWNNLQSVQAFIVDHGLRSGSAKEAEIAKARATDMGASARILVCKWPMGIPKSGIQEKARNARYQLLGDACREQGIDTLLLGHNQDDQAETVMMRRNSSSGWRGLAGIKQRSHAPIWPALQGLNIVRPLLSCGRVELHLYNKNNNLQWIDDPSNNNTTFTRIRARGVLSDSHNEKRNLLTTSKAASKTLEQEQRQISSFIDKNTKIHFWGGLELQSKFFAGNSGQIAESLRYLLPAVSGEALPPSYEKRVSLAQRLCTSGFAGATLGGVRFVPQGDNILCVRDLGAIIGRANVQALAPMPLERAKTSIWDGRFAVSSRQSGIYVDILANWKLKLDKRQNNLLKSLPEPMRGSIPVFIRNNQIAYIPYVDFSAGNHGFKIYALTAEHLSSLLGDYYR